MTTKKKHQPGPAEQRGIAEGVPERVLVTCRLIDELSASVAGLTEEVLALEERVPMTTESGREHLVRVIRDCRRTIRELRSSADSLESAVSHWEQLTGVRVPDDASHRGAMIGPVQEGKP